MAVVPLTAKQQQAVDDLVRDGDFRKVPEDEQRARVFLEQAHVTLVDIPNLTQSQNRYNLAYDAAHDVGEAMLRAYGYKNKWGPGAHQRLAQFLAAIFDTPPPSEAALHFETMRSDRNENRYQASLFTNAGADEAEHTARTLYDAASARLA